MIGYYWHYYMHYAPGYVIGGLIGLALGLGIAFLITMYLVMKSNDIGDSKGSLADFGYLKMLCSEDGLHHHSPSGQGVALIWEDQRQEKESLIREGFPVEQKVIEKPVTSKNIFSDRFGEGT